MYNDVFYTDFLSCSQKYVFTSTLCSRHIRTDATQVSDDATSVPTRRAARLAVVGATSFVQKLHKVCISYIRLTHLFMNVFGDVPLEQTFTSLRHASSPRSCPCCVRTAHARVSRRDAGGGTHRRPDKGNGAPYFSFRGAPSHRSQLDIETQSLVHAATGQETHTRG